MLEIVNENGNWIELAQNILLVGVCVSCCETIAQSLPFVSKSFSTEHKISILISDFYVNIIRMSRLGMLSEQRAVLPSTAFQKGDAGKFESTGKFRQANPQ